MNLTITKTFAKWLLVGTGTISLAIALTAHWIRLDPNNGWGPRRVALLITGCILLVAAIVVNFYKRKIHKPLFIKKIEEIQQWVLGLSIITMGFPLVSNIVESISRHVLMLQRKYKDNHGHPARFASLLIAVILVVGVFPDVIFQGASISMLDLYNVEGFERRTNTLYSQRAGSTPLHGYSDYGGAALQSEPSQQFMKFVINNGESPFWNPYSAAGSMGPETLVDLKFSPFSILVALAGGSSFAFHLIFLALNVIAVYFLFRTLTVFLNFSTLASLAACVVFMLNGYNVANLNSNVSQVLLYYPICLYAILHFTNQPSVGNYLGIVFSNILILATTFMPTTVLILICIYVFAGGYVLRVHSKLRVRAMAILFYGSSVLIAFMLLAFLYFPIFESFKVATENTLYNARVFYPANIGAFLSFFTPKHFFESYMAIDAVAAQFARNTIFHFGIVVSAVLAQIFGVRKYWKDAAFISLACLFFISLARIFDVPIISNIVGVIPFLGSIGEQYWWIVVSFSFTLLFAFGFEVLELSRIKLLPSQVALFLVITCVIYLYSAIGFPKIEQPGFNLDFADAKVYIRSILAFVGTSMLIFYGMKKDVQHGYLYRVVLIGLIFVELVSYMNTTRYLRRDIFSTPPDYVTFIKERIGNYRIINYGGYGVFPELGAAFQIQQLESMNMNVLPSYYDFCYRNLASPSDRWAGYFCTIISQPGEVKVDETILSMMGVKYIIVNRYMDKYARFFDKQHYPMVFENSALAIYENPDVYPRMFAVPVLMDANLTPDTQGFSPRDVVFSVDPKLITLAKTLNIPNELATDLHASFQSNKVILQEYRNAYILARAKLTYPAVVVMMDNFHPNWKAYVNGKEVYIGKVNESFRGIALAPGEYTIEMRYTPATLPYGLALSGIMVLVLGMVFAFRHKIEAKMRALQPASPEQSRAL